MMLALLTALLSSCIEGDEEIFLNADGSARMKVMYSLPALLLSSSDAESLKKNIQDGLGNDDRIELLRNTVEKIDGKQVITIEVATANVLELEGFMDEGSGLDDEEREKGKSEQIVEALLGECLVNRSGLSADIQRKIDLAPLLDKHAGGNWPSMVGDSEFRYTVHFPTAVDASNAHEVSNDGKTVMWKYKLRDLREKPIELNVSATAPIPWWVYVSVALVALLVILIGWKLIRRKAA